MKDYYNILSLPKSCTETEIKKAYRKLALKWHPDRNKAPEAEDRFIEITEAYDILSDPVKRARLDRILSGKVYTSTIKKKPQKKSSYEEWMEYQAKKAKAKAKQKARKKYRKYKREEFGYVSKEAFWGASAIFLGFYLITIMTIGSPDEDGNEYTSQVLGALVVILIIIFLAWLALRKQFNKHSE